MAERRRALAAEERLAEVARDKRRLHKARLQRELAGPRWHRMARITPALFDREGTLHVRRLTVDRGAAIAALKEEAVFALDTAMRIERGYGFLAGGDVHAYLLSDDPLEDLSRCGLLERDERPDSILLRPFAGPPRLFAAVVDEMPPSRRLASGHRVVTRERLARELIGAVGARADLFALLER